MDENSLKWYEGLDEEKKSILQVMAFSFDSLDSFMFVKLFRGLKMTYEGTKINSYNHIHSFFKIAESKGILLQKNSILCVNSSWIPFLINELKANGVSLSRIAQENALFNNSFYVSLQVLFSRFLQNLLIGDKKMAEEFIHKINFRINYESASGSINTSSYYVFLGLKLNLLDTFPKNWILQSADFLLWELLINYKGLSDAIDIFKHCSSKKVVFIETLNLLQNGKLSQVVDLEIDADNYDARSVIPIAMWYLGRKNEALAYYDSLIKEYNSVAKKRVVFIDNESAVFWMPIFLTANKSKTSRFKKFRKDSSQSYYYLLYVAATAVDALMNPNPYDFLVKNIDRDMQGLEGLLHLLLASWLTENVADTKLVNENIRYVEVLKNKGLLFHAWELACYVKTCDSSFDVGAVFPDVEFKESIISLHRPRQEWENKLQSILNLTVNSAKQSDERLIWLVNFEYASVQPVLQKLTKSGMWSAGRNVALSKIAKQEIECMTDKDVAMASFLGQDYWSSNYYFSDNAVLGLVGHPLLFLEDARNVPIELVKEDILLVIEEKKDECVFSFSHVFSSNERFFIDKLATNKYCLYYANDTLIEIQKIIKNKLCVPLDAKDVVLKAIDRLSAAVTIQSSLIGENSNATEQKASVAIYAHLLPLGTGLNVELFVKPLDPLPPYLRPTEGLKKIIAKKEDQNIWCERDFKKEQNAVTKVLDMCPMLASLLVGATSVQVENPSDSLRIISELNKCPDVVVEWPKGVKYAIKGTFGASAFNIALKKKNNWFEMSGNVALDDKTDLTIQDMLKLISQSNDRFIEIADGTYIELEKTFMRQLKQLQSFSDISKKEVKAHPLAMISVMDLLGQANLSSCKEWNNFEKQIKKADKKTYPLPSGLEAQLRPYQIDGYEWLCKLAHWQSGACLADDMGLGKTLQCIALLLARKQNGPALVVAPSSVCRNWVSEIRKFAPSLDPVLFGSGDRKAMIDQAHHSQVVITSYGLLNTEAELLASKLWHTLILDEAHAIKNINTKRSQAVHSFNADFKIALTGTPLQNHMGELWNLFQFLNPGLLGSQSAFSQRFVQPIERMDSEDARTALKNIIKPFMLRRLKNQVLDELPEKTEITMAVDLSEQERAFYEAMRIKSIEEIQKLDNDSSSGEKQIKVLAEITKLRRICCHPSLSGKDIPIESSKLARFEQLVDLLIDNNHKALVFSQFVDHLSIIRALLDKKKISYEYLDGSTPGKKREESINRFQAGSADLFLISLKAGGVGLNLTAADYVIHMDPWWNPAVEDQASDRAHRIGQTRPVTIYRLVAKDTIEERIVEMHKHKRDLADSLLHGTDAAHKITADDLIDMIRQNTESMH